MARNDRMIDVTTLEGRGDEELARAEESIRRGIQACRDGQSAKRLQIELCYVQREIAIRNDRVAAARAIAAAAQAGDGQGS